MTTKVRTDHGSEVALHHGQTTRQTTTHPATWATTGLTTPCTRTPRHLSSAEPAGLEALRRATWTQTVKPQMLCDELQGRLLAALSHMIAPTRVLELGTFTGYATACWAEGLAL